MSKTETEVAKLVATSYEVVKAERDRAVELLREVCEDLDWKNELYPGGTAHAKLRAFLKEVDNG